MTRDEAALLQFFVYAHLPPNLQEVSKPFCDMAHRVVSMPAGDRAYLRDQILASQVGPFSELTYWAEDIGCNVEATWCVVKIGEAKDMFAKRETTDACLRKLLEAKDCAVRAVLYKEPPP